MEDGSEMIMTGGDPAGMDYDGDGNPIEEEVAPMADATGTKIDYSREDPVPFQKTATLVNYFITNTAQFLNTFTQVAETKMHEVDERLDEIEQILALYESKLDLPEEFFENIDEIPVPEVQQQEIVARTENPLQNAMEAPAKTSATRARTEVQKKQAGKAGGATDGGAPEKKSFVPPPPKDSPKIPAPAGMPKVKTFPISTGPPPNGMSFPGLEAAAPAQTPEGGAPAEGAGAEEEVDDGFTPEQRRKNHLEQDASFKKFLMMHRMKIPLVNIRNKIKADPSLGFTPADIDLFATEKEIEEANYSLDVM